MLSVREAIGLDRLSIASLFSAIEIQEYDIHPDGRKAICSVNRGRNWELATLDLKTGSLRKFQTGEQSLMSPSYSPAGDAVVYHVDFEGNENHDVVIVRADGRETKKLTDGVEDNYEPRFSPDGGLVAFLSNRDKDIDNLFVVPAGGGEIRKLTNEPLPVRQFAWSPDSRLIAYETGVGDNNYISVVDARKGKARKLLSRKGVEFSLSGNADRPEPWSADGSTLLYVTNENDPVDIGLLDMSTRKTKLLVKSMNEKYAPMWSPDGERLAYLEVEDPNVVVKMKVGRRTVRISPRDGTSRALRWLPDGSGVTFVNGASDRPEELFAAKGPRPRKVSRFQRKPLDRRQLAYPKLVHYESFDGERIAALLYLPKDRSRRAGVVMPHGGPEAQDTNAWDQLTHMLVDKGFVVIKPNYRGSTGYGRRFLHLHDRDLGGGDFMDTVYAGKYLIDSGLVDKERLGYWGASYSGYTCMLALTKVPDMWAAGVSIVGFFDWQTEHATERGYLKAYDESKMGDFSKNPEFFRERSPIYFLENLKAPHLMTASTRDVRCPPTEARAVVQRLKELGKRFEYHEYTDEGHWPRKRKNLIDLYKRSTSFLDRHIPR